MSAAQNRAALSPRGRSVLVTGASSGLGRVCALELEEAGFRVFAGVRKEADALALAEASAHGRIVPVLVDVTDEKSVARPPNGSPPRWARTACGGS